VKRYCVAVVRTTVNDDHSSYKAKVT
jgi:hypothetical protein